MSKNTLYITFDGLSDPLGQSQILPYLCGIANNGYSITILSCEKKERLKQEKDTINHLIKDLPITWHSIHYAEEGGILSRLNYIRQVYRLAKKTIKQKHVGLVHCRSYLASLIGLKLKYRYNIPFIFDMRGFWADERLDGGIWRKTNFLHRLFYHYFKAKERIFILQSDAIVSLTHAAVKELSKNFPKEVLDKKTSVIPCCANTELFDPQNVKLIRIEGIESQHHVIIYTGSIGTWYYTREMIDCILRWKKMIPNIRLLILTKDTEALRSILDSYSTEEQKIIVTKSASYKEVPSYLAMARAAIFFIKPSHSKIASSPTKMAECWAMNLPIITNAGIGDNDLYFNQRKGGVLVRDFKSQEYDQALQAYLQLNTTNHYRSLAVEHFNTKTAIQKYTNIYKFLSS